MGGPNGAGKTTFALSFQRLLKIEYLSADALASEINPVRPDQVSFQAGRTFFKKLRQALVRGDNILIESTLSGRGLKRHLSLASSLGYTLSVMYLFISSPDTCVARVTHRVLRGGHHVPGDDVRRRYGRSIRNFWREYRYSVDRWALYNNSSDECVAIATGSADNMTVQDDQMLKQFLNKADENKT